MLLGYTSREANQPIPFIHWIVGKEVDHNTRCFETGQAMAGIQSVRDVTVHFGAAADAAFSGSHNDEIHRAWFVRLAEQIMSRAVGIGLIQSFRVQCDPEDNPDGLVGTEHFKAHVFYKSTDTKWCNIELIFGQGDWFIIDSGAVESTGL